MAALPHDETRQDSHSEVDEPNASLAWRILSSARTFGVLATLMAALLALAAVIPQRLPVNELASALPFAVAAAVRSLGLDDILVSWPFLLVALLMALNLSGLWLASRMGAPRAALFELRASGRVEADQAALEARAVKALGRRAAVTREEGRVVITNRGLVSEGLMTVFIGVATLLAALAVARGSALDGRLALIPGASTLPESTVRDGDLMLLRQLPFGLFCKRPDPQDTRRAFACQAAQTGGEPTALTLTPGQTTQFGAFTLKPLAERLRVPRETDPLELVLHRPDGPERLTVAAGVTVELKRGGERLTAFHGPDGPLVVLQAEGQPTKLLLPTDAAVSGDLRIEVEHPTTVSIAATTAPEWYLVLAGAGLVVLGFLFGLLFPQGEVTLRGGEGGVWVEARSWNRDAGRILKAITGEAAPAGARFGVLEAAVAVGLSGLGLALGLLAAPTTAAVPLALATWVALGTKAAPVLGAVTLVAGLGTAPEAAQPELLSGLASLAAGGALGLLARWLARDLVLARSPLLLAGLGALALGVLHLLPAPALQAADSAGAPLELTATLVDGASSMRAQWPVAVYTPGQAGPLAPLMWLGLVVAVLAFAWHQRPQDARTPRVAWVVAGFGGVAVLAGLVGIAQLFGSGTFEAEALRHQLDLGAPGTGTLAVLATPWELRLWSRPFLDGLTVILGGLMLWAALPAARGKLGAEPARTQAPAWVWLAAALGATAAFLLALGGLDGGALWALGAAVLVAGALVSQRDARAVLMSRLLLTGAAAMSVATWLAPALT